MSVVMNIMRVDHALKIVASFRRSPPQTLVHDDIMKDEIKNSVAEYAQSCSEHVWIIVHL
jgi:hypothetical protein